jgi:hypothetical protein
MTRRRRLSVTLGVVAALASAGTALGAVVTPPAGTPNLALMAIQPSDLTAGAVIGGQNYVTPPTGFTADYGSYFSTSATPDGVSYYDLEDYVALAPSSTLANEFIAAETQSVTSHKGRKAFVKASIKQAGKKAHLVAKDFKFSGAGSMGVGTDSFVETLTITVKHKKVREVLAWFNVGSVSASLLLVGETNEKIPQSDAILLATAMDTHINAVLSGATGPSGTTGASGAT